MVTAVRAPSRMPPVRSSTVTRSQGGVSRSNAPARSCQAKASSAETGNVLLRSTICGGRAICAVLLLRLPPMNPRPRVLRRTLARPVLAGVHLWSCGPAPGSAATQPSPFIVERFAARDAFSCRDGRRVRLIGIDTPELAQGAWGRQARSALSRLAPPGSSVRLERDVAPRDRYGRELAHVWAGARLVNE